jgi:hypothetical protein
MTEIKNLKRKEANIAMLITKGRRSAKELLISLPNTENKSNL